MSPQGCSPNGRHRPSEIGIVGRVPDPRTRKLTATSYVVLGMLSYSPATSYDLKQWVANTIGNFWAFAHSQLYDEPARLVADGWSPRRSRRAAGGGGPTRSCPPGREALREWLSSPTDEQTEVRDLGLLKLFFLNFGTRKDLLQLARDRHESHRARADAYEEQRAEIVDYADRWQVKTIELGIRYERCVEQFWADFIKELEEEDQSARAARVQHARLRISRSGLHDLASWRWKILPCAHTRYASPGRSPPASAPHSSCPCPPCRRWPSRPRMTPRSTSTSGGPPADFLQGPARGPAAHAGDGLRDRPARPARSSTPSRTSAPRGPTSTAAGPRPAYRQGFDATQLVASWNASTPEDTWLAVEMQGTTATGAKSQWYTMGRWALERHRHHPHDGPRPGGRGRLHRRRHVRRRRSPSASYQLRVTLYREQGTQQDARR